MTCRSLEDSSCPTHVTLSPPLMTMPCMNSTTLVKARSCIVCPSTSKMQVAFALPYLTFKIAWKGTPAAAAM